MHSTALSWLVGRGEAEPVAEAARGALLRRVHLDLTGLPPTADELKAFLEDKRPDAYERVVDKLLASPITASAGDGTGWIWLGMRIRTGTPSTLLGTSGNIAIG
jgi:hypothetical protein